MLSTDAPITIEQNYTASIERVWSALTKIDEMRQWYFDNIPSFEPEVGYETRFAVHVEDRKFTHLWKIIEVIPNKKITYTWRYEEYPGEALTVFELFEKENHVKLKLFLEVLESFPAGIPEFKRESGIAGWNYFLGKNLKAYLEAKSSQ